MEDGSIWELRIVGGVFPESSCLHDIDRSTYEEMHRSCADGGVNTTTSFLFEDEGRLIFEPLHLHEPNLW